MGATRSAQSITGTPKSRYRALFHLYASCTNIYRQRRPRRGNKRAEIGCLLALLLLMLRLAPISISPPRNYGLRSTDAAQRERIELDSWGQLQLGHSESTRPSGSCQENTKFLIQYSALGKTSIEIASPAAVTCLNGRRIKPTSKVAGHTNKSPIYGALVHVSPWHPPTDPMLLSPIREKIGKGYGM